MREEGERIVKTLGNNKAVILQNHGPLCVPSPNIPANNWRRHDQNTQDCRQKHKKRCVMVNHVGSFALGCYVCTSHWICSRLERECQVQLLAGPAATQRGIKPIQINKEEAEYTYARLGTERSGEVFARVSRMLFLGLKKLDGDVVVGSSWRLLALLPGD